MSSVGSTGTSTASTSTGTQYGTNVAPVSFPGISSGIDYESIIEKYTNMTLEQETPLQTKVTSLNSQQTELLKIQDLVSKFQDTFQAVSDPANFTATTPTSSNASALTAASTPNSFATPGTYVISKATLATATQIGNDAAANGSFDQTKTLATAGASITPVNGTTGTTTTGQVTINGVALSYDVNTTTLQSFIGNSANQAALAAVGVTMSYDTTSQKVTISSTQPLTLGSASDQGNLLSVLKLDTAPIAQSGGTYTATSTTQLGGINLGSTFNASNNAGFSTAVTSGTFTINGVNFSVDATANNLNDMLQKINASAAGVYATYDSANDKILLTAKSDGPQGIVIGASGDTSNFLQAAGFLANYSTPSVLSSGAATVVGKAAAVQYTDAAGTTHSVYSNSNTLTNVIPGVSLTLQQAIDGTTVTPVTVSVAQDSTTLQTAIKSWVDAYNAVISEINTATQAPVVGTTSEDSSDSSTDSDGQTSGTQLTAGGVLFNNQEVLDLKNQMVSMVSSMVTNTGSTSYNSLASIGLTLDSSFTEDSADSSDSSNTTTSDSVTTQTYQGTSGQLDALDVDTFTAALAADSTAVQALFVGDGTSSDTSISMQLGSYLTSATGLPTQLTSGIAGTIPTTSMFTTLSTENQDQITSLQQQIQLVTDQANLQADRLRTQFTASEGLIAQLQSEQSSLSSLLSGS